MWSGKSLQLLCILPFGMLCLSAISMMFVKIMLAVCMLVGMVVCLVQHIGSHCSDVMYFGCFSFRGELGFLNCDDVYMCFVNKQFELFEFAFDSVYVDLQYDEISLTFTAGSVSLCFVCGRVVVFGLSVSLSWHPMWMKWLL